MTVRSYSAATSSCHAFHERRIASGGIVSVRSPNRPPAYFGRRRTIACAISNALMMPCLLVVSSSAIDRIVADSSGKLAARARCREAVAATSRSSSYLTTARSTWRSLSRLGNRPRGSPPVRTIAEATSASTTGRCSSGSVARYSRMAHSKSWSSPTSSTSESRGRAEIDSASPNRARSTPPLANAASISLSTCIKVQSAVERVIPSAAVRPLLWRTS
jgi:hypothetical protein